MSVDINSNNSKLLAENVLKRHCNNYIPPEE